MRTFIFQNDTIKINLKAKDNKEAWDIARYTRMKLLGEKNNEDKEINKYFKLSQYQKDFRDWFNSLGE